MIYLASFFFFINLVYAGQVDRRWITPDFFVDTDQHAHSGSALSLRTPQLVPSDCKNNIREALCHVEDFPDAGSPAACLPDSLNYSSALEAVYNEYPEWLQKMFCHFTRIWIVKNFEGSAAAGINTDPKGNPLPGARLYLRQSILDEKPNLSLWASWKEQLSFGGDPKSFNIRKDLPMILSSLEQYSQGTLKFLLAHELGHVFDFANHLNSSTDCIQHPAPGPNQPPVQECKPNPKSWMAFSWQTSSKRKPELDFSDFSGLCFYSCEGTKLGMTQVLGIYDALFHRSNFISLYATGNPYDDFAESLAYHVIIKEFLGTYQINTGQSLFYDLRDEFDRDLFSQKRAYIEDFLGSKIIYP